MNAQNKRKVNIFDSEDPTTQNQEQLKRLGHDERALIPHEEDSQSQISQTSSQLAITNGVPARKQNTIEYLKKGKQQKESVRDFILNARNILMAQISINDKTEETELLKEYIIMEKERLDANKKTF